MIYLFRDVNTGEISEHSMKLADYDQFQSANPHLERYHSVDSLPGFGDAMRMNVPGIGKPDSTFEKYVINRIKETVPGNNLHRTHKTKSISEF